MRKPKAMADFWWGLQQKTFIMNEEDGGIRKEPKKG
jgi:hypothetical protein